MIPADLMQMFVQFGLPGVLLYLYLYERKCNGRIQEARIKELKEMNEYLMRERGTYERSPVYPPAHITPQ